MINILPYHQKKMIDRLRILRVMTTTLWAIIFIIGAAMLLLVPLLFTINSRFAITEKQIAELERSGVVISPINVATIRERTSALSTKLASTLPPSPVEYVSIIKGAQSAGINISGYSMENNNNILELEVVGVASTREGLQRFIASLQKNEKVATVESPVSNYVKRTNSPFTIKVTFK